MRDQFLILRRARNAPVSKDEAGYLVRAGSAATGGICRLQFVSPPFQRAMSNCILAASSGGMLRFWVLTTV
jgi:hypothetical protein